TRYSPWQDCIVLIPACQPSQQPAAACQALGQGRRSGAPPFQGFLGLPCCFCSCCRGAACGFGCGACRCVFWSSWSCRCSIFCVCCWWRCSICCCCCWRCTLFWCCCCWAAR